MTIEGGNDVSVGESVRIIRELQGLSQNELSRLTKIPQSTISAIENSRVNLGVERAKAIGHRFFIDVPAGKQQHGGMTLKSASISACQRRRKCLRGKLAFWFIVY